MGDRLEVVEVKGKNEAGHDIILADDGEEYLRFKNGTLYDHKKGGRGGIVQGPDNPPFLDPEIQQKAERVRWENTRKEIEEGMIRGTKDARSGPEAAGIIAEEQTKLAMNPEQGRASTNAADWLVRNAGLVRQRGDAPVKGLEVTTRMDADMAREVLDRLREIKRDE